MNFMNYYTFVGKQVITLHDKVFFTKLIMFQFFPQICNSGSVLESKEFGS